MTSAYIVQLIIATYRNDIPIKSELRTSIYVYEEIKRLYDFLLSFTSFPIFCDKTAAAYSALIVHLFRVFLSLVAMETSRTVYDAVVVIQVIKDYQLMAIVCVLVLLDVLVLSIWEFIDPLDVVVYNKTMEYIVSTANISVCFHLDRVRNRRINRIKVRI